MDLMKVEKQAIKPTITNIAKIETLKKELAQLKQQTNFNERRVLKLGNSFGVTMPGEWMQELGIKHREKVYVVKFPDAILIIPKKSK